MNQKMSINNMTCIENRISEYYEIRKIPKKVWMKLLQDNIKRSRGTIEKNVVKIKTAENLRDICITTDLTSDYLLGLSEEKSTFKMDTYKDAFYFAKYMIDKNLIIRCQMQDGQEYYVLSGKLNLILINYHDLTDVINRTINVFLYDDNGDFSEFDGCAKCFELDRLEIEWIDICKKMLNLSSEKKPIMKILGDNLNEQIKLYDYSNREFMEKFNDYVNKMFTRNDGNQYFAKKSSYDLARIGDVSYVSKYRNGLINMGIEKVIAFSKFFGKSVDYFLGLENDYNNISLRMVFTACIEMQRIGMLTINNSKNDVDDDECKKSVCANGILSSFCKEYYSACQSADENALKEIEMYHEKISLIRKKNFFHRLADDFTMSIDRKKVCVSGVDTLDKWKTYLTNH